MLHSVLFDNSLYAVLADADDDQPLLDVAFPDVTARCRGLQIKSYNLPEAEEGLVPRRLSVWEGRRRGAIGVGWGTAAALAAGGAAVPKDGSITAGLKKVQTNAGKKKKSAGRAGGGEAKGVDDEPAAAAAAGGKEQDDDDGAGGKTDEAEEARVAAAAAAKKRADAARAARAASSGKEADGDEAKAEAGESKSGAGSGAGAGARSTMTPTRGGLGGGQGGCARRALTTSVFLVGLMLLWVARLRCVCLCFCFLRGGWIGLGWVGLGLFDVSVQPSSQCGHHITSSRWATWAVV